MTKKTRLEPETAREAGSPRGVGGGIASMRLGPHFTKSLQGSRRTPAITAIASLLTLVLLLSSVFVGKVQEPPARTPDTAPMPMSATAGGFPADAGRTQFPAPACPPGAAAGLHDCPSSARSSTPPPVNASDENWVEFNQSRLPDADLNGLGLAFDPKENETVLFGACPTGSASPCNGTWVFRHGNWSELHPLVSPPRAAGVAMAYDPQSQSVVLFGGALINETWEFSGGNWSEQNTTVAPPPGSDFPMVYDAAMGSLLLFAGGGPNATNGTWAFDNDTWVNLPVTVEPAYANSMAYDPIHHAAVVYGGEWPQNNCTWLFRNGSWNNVTPVNSPPVHAGASLSYDPLSQSVILFGGFGSVGQYLGQTWAFDGSNWTRLLPSNAPSPRVLAAMAYDSRDALTLLVGGGDSETWAFGAGNVAFVSSPGPGGSTRMGASLHANGTTAWLPFNTYSLRAVPNPGYSGRGTNISGSLVPINGSYLLFGNSTVESSFLAFPTVTLDSVPSGCDLDFNGTQYANGSSPYFAAPGTFSLSAPPCGTVLFGAWSVRGNASVANVTNSTTRITLSGRATVVAHFLANIEFYADPAGAGAIAVNGSRVSLATPVLFPVGAYPIQALAAPGWRLASLTTSGNGLGIGNGLLSVENSGGVRATFAAHPSVVIETTDPECGQVAFESIPEPNGSLVGTDLGTFPVAAPSCTDSLFENWQSSGNVTVSAPTHSNTTVSVTGNGTLEAVLGRAAWLTVWIVPSAQAGYLEWNGSRLENGTHIHEFLGLYPIEAVAVAGWAFFGWETVGGVAERSSTAVLSSNGTLVAAFENTSSTTPTGGGGGPGSATILGLTVGEWAVVIAAAVVAVAIVAVLSRRQGRRNPAEEPTGNAELGGEVDPDEGAGQEEEPV